EKNGYSGQNAYSDQNDHAGEHTANYGYNYGQNSGQHPAAEQGNYGHNYGYNQGYPGANPGAFPGYGDGAGPVAYRRRRKKFTWHLRWIIPVFLVVAITIFGFSPSPYIIEKPGPTLNTLGDIELENKKVAPVLTVNDPQNSRKADQNHNGKMYMLTVSVSGNPEHPRNWFSLLEAVGKKSHNIVPMEDHYPKNSNVSDINRRSRIMMADSQNSATAAALKHLGYNVPVTFTVDHIIEGAPANEFLKAGDILLQANGKKVESSGIFRKLYEENGGKPIDVTFERDGNRQTVKIPSFKQKERYLLGAMVKSDFQLPVKVEYAVEGIGGPSAGMIFALSIIDKLTPGDITGGKVIAGTGTIASTGEIGPIGGLKQKLYAAADRGAQLFLMPRDNCRDVPDEVPGQGKMQVAVVSNLNEALAALKGEKIAGVDTCKK
ncbi:MAG: S16 family serine protease, partial [Microbacteriaceae bacterium]|nr:S16 family serine protease [Microbacteriaceae bacterium]